MASKKGKKDEVEVIDERQIIAEEDLVIDAQFLIQEALLERGMTRAELAERAGVSKARLSQLMRAEANPTLRTLAKLFYALNDELHLSRKVELPVSAEKQCSWEQPDPSVTPPRPQKTLKIIYEKASSDFFPLGQACNDDSPQFADANGLTTAIA